LLSKCKRRSLTEQADLALMPFGAAGSVDVRSRLLAPTVSRSLGQSVVVVKNCPCTTASPCRCAMRRGFEVLLGNSIGHKLVVQRGHDDGLAS
jgi:hypothetical protein